MHTKPFKSYLLQPLVDRSASLLRILLAALSFIAALILSGCNQSQPVSNSVSEPGRPVRVVGAESLTTAQTLRLPAAVRATERAQLAFLQPGYLAERRVQRGQTVSEGEVLAILNNPTLQPGVAAAEARVNESRSRLAQLERDTKRLGELVQRNLAADDELEQTRANRDVARATLGQAEAQRDQARNQLLDASLRAPFDGQIVELLLEPGDFAAAGQAILTINGSGLEIELQLPGRHAASLDEGQILQIIRADDGQTASALIEQVGRAQPGQTAPVIARLDSQTFEGWQAGDAVYAELELEATEVLSVPLTSIVNPGTRYSRVFRVRDNQAEVISVETGRTLRGWAEINGPLQAGDQIIIAGQAQLLDGEAVRIIE